MFALATGGADLSQTARVEYYDGVVAAERQTRLLNAATGRPSVLGILVPDCGRLPTFPQVRAGPVLVEDGLAGVGH